MGERTLAKRVAPRQDRLTPVCVRDTGRLVPGVLLAWDKREGSWWGLVAWDPGSGQQRMWLASGRLEPILPR
jgi:hypothetical protein